MIFATLLLILECNCGAASPRQRERPGASSGGSSSRTSGAAGRSCPSSASRLSRRWRSARSKPGQPVPMSALADALHCDNSNITGIVDRLEAAGLAERRPSERDRRVKAVVLTEKGEWMRIEIDRRAGEPPPQLAALSDEDAIALRDILDPRAGDGLSGRQRARRLADVARRRADQPALALLLEDVRRPARRPRAREQRREQLGRDLARGRARPPTRTRRWWRARGPACGPGARRAPPPPAPRRPRRAASRSPSRCVAGPARADPRRGTRGGRTPSAARRGRARRARSGRRRRCARRRRASCSTRAGAPPCSGPDSAPTAADSAAATSAPVEATTRAVNVEAFMPCSAAEIQ